MKPIPMLEDVSNCYGFTMPAQHLIDFQHIDFQLFKNF